MVIGIGTFLFLIFGNYAKEVELDKEKVQINSFNQKFLKYENSDNITIHDIITLANFAIENNKKYELSNNDSGNEATLYVQVIANFSTSTSSNRKEDLTLIDKNGNPMLNYTEIIEHNSYDKQKENSQILYRCKKINISKITKRVYSIEFEKIR